MRPRTVALCVVHLAASAMAVLLSKAIIDKGFAYPIFVNCVTQSGVAAACRVLATSAPDQTDAHIIGGVSVWSSLSHILGHYAYLYLTISIVQILKALTPVVVVAVLWALNIERPSVGVVASVTGLSISGAVICAQEVEVRALGPLLMLGSSVADGLRLALIQGVVERAEPIRFLERTSWWSAAITLPFVVHELPSVWHAPRMGVGIGLTCAHALVACVVSSSGIYLVRDEGSTMLKVITMMRNVFLVGGASVWTGRGLTAVQVVAYLTLMANFMLYVRLSSRHAGRGEGARCPV